MTILNADLLVSKDDVDKLIAQQEDENMKKKTMYDLKVIRKVWKEETEFEKIPTEELNVYLSELIIAARTKKGSLQASSLLGQS